MDDSTNGLIILDSSLLTVKFLAVVPNHQNLQWSLEKEFVHYKYIETIAETFIHLVKTNLFSKTFSTKLQ